MNGKSDRQDRIENLVEQGYAQAEAEGVARAEQAGYQPFPSPRDDNPGTIGFDRPGAKRET
jgi:hypothetical protein